MTNTSSTQFDLMQWILRLVAIIIDSIICFIPYIIIYLAIAIAVPNFFIFGGFLLGPFIFGIIEVLYFVFLEVYWDGATVGKRLLLMKVQLTNGGKVTIDKSIVRNISKIIWIFVILDWLLAVLIPGPDQHQKYTDRIAGTTVIQIKQPVQAVQSTAQTQTSPSPPAT